jgi:hypothetical protein
MVNSCKLLGRDNTRGEFLYTTYNQICHIHTFSLVWPPLGQILPGGRPSRPEGGQDLRSPGLYPPPPPNILARRPEPPSPSPSRPGYIGSTKTVLQPPPPSLQTKPRPKEPGLGRERGPPAPRRRLSLAEAPANQRPRKW